MGGAVTIRVRRGARPPTESDYYYPNLANDVVAIADALGWRRFHLVTHDHGAVLGWVVAALYPDWLASFTALAVPHLDAFSEAILRDPVQQAASQYFHILVQPGSEEHLYATFVTGQNKIYEGLGCPESSRSGAPFCFSPAVLRKALWWSNGVMGIFLATPPIPNGLRAQIGQTVERMEGKSPPASFLDASAAPVPVKPTPGAIGKIRVPSLYTCGSKDGALTRAPALATKDYVASPYKFVELESGHWMTYEEILVHLQAHPLAVARL